MAHSGLPLIALLAALAAVPAIAQSNVSFEILSNPTQFGLAANAQTTINSPVVGDFNRDGKPDILAAGQSSGQALTFFAGNGAGGFASPTTAAASSTIERPLAVADLDGDGNLDVIAEPEANIGSLVPVNVFYGNGDGTFDGPYPLTQVTNTYSVAVGNFDGDGLSDIALGFSGYGGATEQGQIDIFKNDGNRLFSQVKTITLASTYGIESLNAADVDEDGHVDLIAGSSSNLVVLWGEGNDNFLQDTLKTYTGIQDLTIQTSVADVNQDGAPDIVVTYSCATQGPGPGKGAATNPCTAIDVFYGGQGEHKTFFRTAVPSSTVNELDSTNVADVNGDGIADLVGSGVDTNGNAGGVFVWLGHPDGSFDTTDQRYIENSFGEGALTMADFNRDGMMDFFTPDSLYLNATHRAPCATSAIDPTVVVCQPVQQTYVPSASLHVQATAYDTKPVTALQEYVNGDLIDSEDASQLSLDLSETPGEYLLVTKAWDAAGTSFRSNRNVFVYDGTPGASCSAAPNSASICLPSDNTAGTTHIVGNGATQFVPTAAQLYVDGALMVDDTTQSSALDVRLALSAGTHSLVFKLFDASGASYAATASVTVP